MKIHIEKKLNRNGFTLIELIVAIFIFSIITVAIVSVFVSTVTSSGKAKAIKTVKENAEFAMSSIAKDVRMGKIEKSFTVGATTYTMDGSTKFSRILIRRNRGGNVCYWISSNFVGIQEGVTIPASPALPNCSNNQSDYKFLVDLSGTGMNLNSNSTFYAIATDTTGRGWAEINLNIEPISGASSIDMSTDSINVQTIVSSRDYGWEDIE